jgi:hypothetical protein
MARLTTFTQRQLASSLVRTAPVDRSGQILANAVGGAANQITGVVLNFAKDKKDAQDSLAINAISESRDFALLKMEQFKQNNSPSMWSQGWDTIKSEQQTSITANPLSNKLAKIESLKQKAFEIEGGIAVEIAAKDKFVSMDIEVNGKRLISILGNPQSNEVEKNEQIERTEAALGRRYFGESFDLRMGELLKEAKKEFFDNKAKLSPKETIEEAVKRKQALSEIGGVDADGLDAGDYTSIISTALKTQGQNKQLMQSNENEVYVEYVSGTIDQVILDDRLNSGDIDSDVHSAYTKLINNDNFMATDAILADKWLRGTLSKDDIQEAQTEGRLKDSNVVAAWMNRLGSGDSVYNTGIYDTALAMTRSVRFDKAQYNVVRQYLLENADDLGSKYSAVREKLEVNMNAEGFKTQPHIGRAHKAVDNYTRNSPVINDGSLESIELVQKMHDAIDARSDFTPEQIRDLTRGLLLPYQEEEAKGWFRGMFDRISTSPSRTSVTVAPVVSPLLAVMRLGKQRRSIRQKAFRSVMLIQPVTKEDFRKKIISLKAVYGENSEEAELFYDKYINSYDWNK